MYAIRSYYAFIKNLYFISFGFCAITVISTLFIIYPKPKEILDLYSDWTSSEANKKVSIMYVTMHHSTEGMARQLGKKLTELGVENNIHRNNFV